MNPDLLRNLESVEKEKNLDRAFMVDVLKTGILSAIQKLFPDLENCEVQIDPLTADIKILQNGVELEGTHFSRIAAQTAKQVIFQRLRKAEQDALYKEYSAKIGDIITGGVHRVEGRNIIVELGEVEAIIPRREQVRTEEYRQGDHIKAYVVEVRETHRGIDVILSRTHPFFVKRLFEIEVPEISEGIVQIKGIVREAGARTKIAVYSKDEKVDSVGSCIGMRGQRVKNIVEELHGEKIDIIRWSPDPETFIRSALAPAELEKITLYPNDRHAEVLVAENQLSLTIGKRGQNVRLGSKLTEWMLDVRTNTQQLFLKELTEIGENIQEILKAAGINSAKDILKRSAEELEQLGGITHENAEKVIAAAHKAFLVHEAESQKASETAQVDEFGRPVHRSRRDQISAELEKAFKQVKPKRAKKKKPAKTEEDSEEIPESELLEDKEVPEEPEQETKETTEEEQGGESSNEQEAGNA